MIAKAESLFGPYEWDRYDMLVLPPSFPYGGMENPRMTFLTPTLLAGDRSLVDVVAHELAHSWTGNLVTNADMDHFWLNEGFTVWAERRIQEAIHGPEWSVLDWAIGQTALDQELARFGPTSPLTRLRTELRGIDPDDAFSSIPYEKGARFLTLLERTRGPRALRPFRARLHRPLPLHLDHVGGVPGLRGGDSSPALPASVDARAWLYEPGIPANAPVFASEALSALTRLAAELGIAARGPPATQIASLDARASCSCISSICRASSTGQAARGSTRRWR